MLSFPAGWRLENGSLAEFCGVVDPLRRSARSAVRRASQTVVERLSVDDAQIASCRLPEIPLTESTRTERATPLTKARHLT